jgi:hypothetical protein
LKSPLRRCFLPPLEAQWAVSANVRFTPKADIAERNWDVRFVPIGDMAAGCNFMRRVHS